MSLQGQYNSPNCQICLEPPDQNMLTCTNCQKRWHTNCTKATSGLPYKCAACISAPEPEVYQTPKHKSSKSVKSTSTSASKSSTKSQRRAKQLQLQRLEEERAVQMEYIAKKYSLMEENDEEDRESDVTSKCSLDLREWVKQLPDPIATDYIQSELKARHQKLNFKNPNEKIKSTSLPDETLYYKLQSHINNFSKSTANENTKSNKPSHEISSNEMPTKSAATVSSHAPVVPTVTAANANQIDYKSLLQPLNQTSQPFYNAAATTTSTYIRNAPTMSHSHLFNTQQFNNQNFLQNNSHLNSTRNHSFNEPSKTFTKFYNAPRLHPGQLHARSSLPKELPNFYGQPEEWPLFFSTFEWTTTVCGFTEAENLIRLQKALRGDALRKVQHMLVHPTNVNWVMSILELLYGQPEKIINSIKNRIKSTPIVNENNLPSFTSFAIDVKSLITTIEACNLPHEINNSSLLQELIEKLPHSYQLQWGTQKLQLMNQNRTPNMYDFSDWIFNIGMSASCITIESTKNKRETIKLNNYENIKTTTSTVNNNNNSRKAFIHTHVENRKCFVCNNNDCKSIANCQKYLALDRGEKWDAVRKHKLCKCCLNKHIGECKKKKICGVDQCQYFHHPSLHRYSTDEETNSNNNYAKNASNAKEIVDNVESINTHCDVIKQVLFKIIPITVHGKNTKVNTFAFIDEGSSISLMDDSLLEQLQISGTSNPLCLKWTGGMERCESNSQKLKIYISGGNKKRIGINVSTVTSLSLPMQSMDYEGLSQQFPHLANLPIKSYVNAVPKILIGLNNFDLGLTTKLLQGAPHEPVAVCTRIGWLVYGVFAEEPTVKKHFNFHICDCREGGQNLDELVKSFYCLDSVGVLCNDPIASKNDERALSLLKQYTIKKDDGHFETPLLWKFDVLNLPNSYDMALKRLLCLEHKLKLNVELLNVFKSTIEKYLNKRYIRRLNEDEINVEGKVWYLPVFAVFNKNKPGKSRVVWDAAAKSNGVSLNSFLLKGPDLLASLPAILFSFRQKNVAVCGDIEEMFHQISIRQEDKNVQRFLWRDCDQSINPQVYVMDVMIFGATCAPSISQYIKNLNADNFGKDFPEAVKVIKENHYVDDLLYSVDTPQEAIKIVNDVKYIHRQGGFNIRNWISNNKDVLHAISDCCLGDKKSLNMNNGTEVEKVLGVFWEHKEDVITFKISQWLLNSDVFTLKKVPTKREMLRLVMSIYDPLGLIGNVIMYVKILLQEVWRSKIDWDEIIPESLMSKWSQWVKILPNISQIKIPRCYLKSLDFYDDVDVELHTFVDASKDGYAAVCYFRLIKCETIICSLIGSKTRVAPIKIVSVPRLELMAALIGARFAKYICDKHTIKICKKYFWSDSKTVISWINSDHRKYSQFVAFRITEILELTSMKNWRWIPTKLNVADEATKWSRSPQISDDSRWYKGPEFLYESKDNWPAPQTSNTFTVEEMVHSLLIITQSEPLVETTRFSQWNRMLRATAYFLRFANNLKTKVAKKGEFTQEELLNAERLLHRQSQKEKYNEEIACLKLGSKISKASDIYKKSPFLDEQGVLRVDGRIDHANVPQEQKQPIILHKSSYITTLIIQYYHAKYHHMNHETAINEMRQKFSISKLRVAFRSAIRKCQWCKIYKVAPQCPQMAKLPRARLASYTSSFSYTGVDFFGPIMVAVNRHREKRYGVLFTCLTIRAVHIEVAHSLNTSSCILAIRNFMARRGIPLEFFSDNGTNFVGAERELREAVENVDKDEFVKKFTSTTTKWNFNPPASPHMGGAWERLVRSVKTVLYKIMPSRAPADELLKSMLMEVENIINSRPLAYVPVDCDTDEALTPNHFLVGSSSGLKPMSACDDSGLLLNKSWLISQQYANIFWKKWLDEYLPTLTCRSKWFEKVKPLCQGDLVIIVDPAFPRNVWPRGKVLETKLAKDGQVRSAKVLTVHGIMERPVAKLAILDVAAKREYDFEDRSRHTAGENVVATYKIA